MADGAVVGALRVVLGLDTAQFSEGIKSTQRELQYAGAQFKRIGGEMASIGTKLSVSITAPLLALGLAAVKGAANFESAMNRVSIATQAGAADMAAMEREARKIGKTTVFSASEAATAMELLAKTGVSVKDILGGAAKATVDLAAATGSELDPAAAAVADTMAQFGLNAAALPGVVNQITGAVNESKLDFTDFQQAMGMAGGVAGGLGVSFADFNAVLAGTSSQFTSGSDAGTSYKTFLSRLTPQTKEAASAIKHLGLSFYEADGSLRSMSDIAGQLQEKLGGLSSEDKTGALRDIFGNDAWRTAMGLMNLGADGLDRVAAGIAKTDAAAQAAQRMGGFAGQLEKLRGALEELSIAIGKSGLLTAVSGLVSGIAGLVEWAAQLPEPILATATAFAAFAAVVGPLIFVGGQMMVAWGSVLTLGGLLTPVWLAVGGALLKVAGSATIAGTAARGLGVAMSFVAGPAGLAIMAAIAGIAFVLGEADRAAVRAAATQRQYADQIKESDAILTEAGVSVSDYASATDAAIDPTKRLTGATDDLAASTFRLADARRQAAVEGLRETQEALRKEADGIRLRQSVLAPFSAEKRAGVAVRVQTGTNADGSPIMGVVRAEERLKQIEAQRFDAQKRALAIAMAPPVASTVKDRPAAAVSSTGADSGGDAKKRGSGKTPAEIAEAKELIDLQVQLDAARARGDVAAEMRLERELDLKQRIAEYAQLGLKDAEAEGAAKKDQAVIDAAIAEGRAKALGLREEELKLQVAQIAGDEKFIALRERQAEIEARRLALIKEGVPPEEALVRAKHEQLRIDQARLSVQQRLRAEAQAAHDLELARLRGDSDEAIRARERAIELERRSREYQSRDYGLSPEEARSRAGAELDAEDAARVQGTWRDAIKGGFRAALEGDFGSWFQSWLADKASKGFESALNTLSDILQKIFADLFKGMSGGSSGGGWGDVLGTVVGAFLPGAGAAAGASSAASHAALKSLPGFAARGSFEVGGSGGIDSQVRAMRLTPGEKVSVTKGDQESAGRMTVRVVSDDPKFRAFIEETAAPMVTNGVQTAVQVARRVVPADMAKSQKYQVG